MTFAEFKEHIRTISMTEGYENDPEYVNSVVRSIPDFPKPGIVFKDITPVLASAEAFHYVINWFAERFAQSGATKVAAAEARGFVFASALAYKMGWGMALIRKPGKLPYETIAESYDLEYGSATLHMHTDAVSKGEKVVIVDDLLATGGTAGAMIHLVERLGGEVVGLGFLMELDFLKPREQAALKGYAVHSMLHVPTEV